MILSSSWDGSVKVTNPLTKECFFDLKYHNGIVWDVVELDDGNIVSVGNDGCINVYEKKLSKNKKNKKMIDPIEKLNEEDDF